MDKNKKEKIIKNPHDLASMIIASIIIVLVVLPMSLDSVSPGIFVWLFLGGLTLGIFWAMKRIMSSHDKFPYHGGRGGTGWGVGGNQD